MEKLKDALLFSLSAGETSLAAMVDERSLSCIKTLFQIAGEPDFWGRGFVIEKFTAKQSQALLKACTPLFSSSSNFAIFQDSVSKGAEIKLLILARAPSENKFKSSYEQMRTTTLFNLFNEGALRGADAAARQALLDSFSLLPNQFLTAAGAIISDQSGSELMRTVPGIVDISDEGGSRVAAIDKFPSLLHVRAERLRADGNRIIPSAMIRDGVYIGKRNIFMFHAAVNIAAYVGDDNLVDSHASLGSSAQIGNKNKISSFVSLEGVLSPANAEPVTIGNENFIGSFARIGTGIRLGDRNFIASGVNISLGTKIRDCRENSRFKGEYVIPANLNSDFNALAIAPNNAEREFHGVMIRPGEYILFENTDEFMARFEGDSRIKSKS